MSDSTSEPAVSAPEADTKANNRLLYWLAVLLVVVGLMNATPGIPGYDALVVPCSAAHPISRSGF